MKKVNVNTLKFKVGDIVRYTIVEGHPMFEGKIIDITSDKKLKPYIIKTTTNELRYANDEFLSFALKDENGTALIPAFQIYKEGHTTSGPVTILKPITGTYDVVSKVAFYKSLGYTVTNIKK